MKKVYKLPNDYFYAQKEGLLICDYEEKMWGQKGPTQKVIENIQAIIDINALQSVCELGTGTGRYMEKMLALNPGNDIYVL